MTELSTQERTTAAVRRTADRSRRLAGLGFVALGGLFLTVVMLASAMAPGYDFASAAISDLGVIPETAFLFNGTLVVVGLLNVLGGVLFYRGHGDRLVLGAFALAGVGAVGAGVFPLDAGGLHSLFALVGFLFFNVQAIAVGVRLSGSGALRALGALAGGVGLVFVVLMVIGDSGTAAAFGPIGHNGTERMIVYPVMLWTVALGGSLLAPRAEWAARSATGD
jgi:hypothetical membrane protein